MLYGTVTEFCTPQEVSDPGSATSAMRARKKDELTFRMLFAVPDHVCRAKVSVPSGKALGKDTANHWSPLT